METIRVRDVMRAAAALGFTCTRQMHRDMTAVVTVWDGDVKVIEATTRQGVTPGYMATALFRGEAVRITGVASATGPARAVLEALGLARPDAAPADGVGHPPDPLQRGNDVESGTAVGDMQAGSAAVDVRAASDATGDTPAEPAGKPRRRGKGDSAVEVVDG
jgi:hypothetical protein